MISTNIIIEKPKKGEEFYPFLQNGENGMYNETKNR